LLLEQVLEFVMLLDLVIVRLMVVVLQLVQVSVVYQCYMFFLHCQQLSMEMLEHHDLLRPRKQNENFVLAQMVFYKQDNFHLLFAQNPLDH
jgi:hypothetical protein